MPEPSSSATLLKLLAVFLLVGANAFFVSAEFALVAARRTRIEGMVRRGDSKARTVMQAIQSLDRYISGTQLGITLASLGLGWIGEPALAGTIEGLFRALPAPLDRIATHGVAAGVAFAIITFLHIVLGELAPKALALRHPEQTSRWVAQPLILFTIATNPFIWALNGTANGILKLFGARAPTERERVHSPEEIMMLVEQSKATGGLGAQNARMIEGVFEFTDKKARDVMTPRTQMMTLPADLTLAAAADRIATAGRSRYPVRRESLDDIVGVVHAKAILAGLRADSSQRVEQVMRPTLFVPGTREVEDVLADMKRQKVHLAIVLDEFGGTAGLVTMEDLLEEIVGQIYDE
jgi:CBS domain containing-hemolysin-like protein